MLTDRFGSQHSSANDSAVAAYEDAVLGIAGPTHRDAGTPARARRRSRPHGRACPEGTGGRHFRRGRSCSTRRGRLWPTPRRPRAAHGGCTASEVPPLIAALAELPWRAGSAPQRYLVDGHAVAEPCDLIAIKLRATPCASCWAIHRACSPTSSVLPAWTASMPGYGFLQGCHAFGLEECGQLEAAEIAGLSALEHEPTDAWALHAVSHVARDTRSNRAGRRLARRAPGPVWSRCNNLSFHMAWHLALLYVEQKRDGEALAIYDAYVRPQPTDDFRDMANAPSPCSGGCARSGSRSEGVGMSCARSQCTAGKTPRSCSHRCTLSDGPGGDRPRPPPRTSWSPPSPPAP